MAPKKTKAVRISEIDGNNMHRYTLPFQEIASAMVMADKVIQDGTVEAYRNKKTGGMMLGYTCPDCDTHHPVIEIHVMEDSSLEDDPRYLMQIQGCIPYAAMLEANGGMLHVVEEPHQPSQDLVAMLAHDFRDDHPTEAEDVYDLVNVAASALLDGAASIALDTLSGMTALGYVCDECESVHAALMVTMPRFRDMRSASGYTFLGNPFLDMMLEDSGERRH
ncbi:hypothetical protein P775_01480 [Puniceibacterium antarcticum]|uniref:Uncharacterized protein n=1 Tax=Puniceibacterium antarcticum TaxID=1206336 RepID=A0A2G8RK72_9RHOB|nr:hypothetical protein [Puniceibacterium antarcticum]PIL21996.1 hypothetical protein P775_01480 [Puniceibacterium antarcticum]